MPSALVNGLMLMFLMTLPSFHSVFCQTVHWWNESPCKIHPDVHEDSRSLSARWMGDHTGAKTSSLYGSVSPHGRWVVGQTTQDDPITRQHVSLILDYKEPRQLALSNRANLPQAPFSFRGLDSKHPSHPFYFPGYL